MPLTTDASHDLRSEDIEEAARIRLQHSPYRAIRRCTCSFDGSTLKLLGQVPTYHYKQLAQAAVANVEGIHAIVNDIQVGDVSGSR